MKKKQKHVFIKKNKKHKNVLQLCYKILSTKILTTNQYVLT